ncbi:L,D-transpeptidase family protein [Novosphingobium sp. ERN07]|uniref:L,D-transpeptidase family protein n=1 Tax=Novosphingobium sp. ERN07 TaxID=2726187 RepID=UPI001457066C|nr:L,D-transpeptidase family protein [Novosphingobium sp. ERN07]NLR71179.1 L,D-transpeptidase family protein [Novosphingobium sp. ERN07]
MRRHLILLVLGIFGVAAICGLFPGSLHSANASGIGASAVQAEDAAAIRVEKAARRLLLLDATGVVLRRFDGIQLGDAPQGHKRFEGDERTPEGRYVIDHGNPQSAYHLSLHISYPNAADKDFAESQGKSPGGQIFIHGQPNWIKIGRVPGDWTDGCIALSNEEIEELWSLVGDGTPIEIVS